MITPFARENASILKSVLIEEDYIQIFLNSNNGMVLENCLRGSMVWHTSSGTTTNTSVIMTIPFNEVKTATAVRIVAASNTISATTATETRRVPSCWLIV